MSTQPGDLVTAKGLRNVAWRLEHKISYEGWVVLYRGTMSGGTHTVDISSGQWSDYFVVDFFASLLRSGTGSSYYSGYSTMVRVDRLETSAAIRIIQDGAYSVVISRVGTDQMKLSITNGTADILVIGYRYADN